MLGYYHLNFLARWRRACCLVYTHVQNSITSHNKQTLVNQTRASNWKFSCHSDANSFPFTKGYSIIVDGFFFVALVTLIFPADGIFSRLYSMHFALWFLKRNLRLNFRRRDSMIKLIGSVALMGLTVFAFRQNYVITIGLLYKLC